MQCLLRRSELQKTVVNGGERGYGGGRLVSNSFTIRIRVGNNVRLRYELEKGKYVV